MTKRQVLTRFIVAAVAVVAVAALAGTLAARAGPDWLAVATPAAALALVGVAAWGCFTPNAPLFGRVVTGRGAADRVVALTFDDGPSPDVTPRILDALRERDARATFFVLGRHAERYPEIVRRIREDGHEVASHGYDHSLLTFAAGGSVAAQLERTEGAIAAAAGAPPSPLFRAPHGFRNPFVGRVARAKGYRVVGWTKGVWDTALPGVDAIVRRTVAGFRAGGILLLHDADGSGAGGDRTQTAEAVPPILDAAEDAGYRLVTVSELHAVTPVRRLQWWRVAAALAVVAVLVELLLNRVDLTVVQQVDVGWWYVGGALLANLVSILLKAAVWKTALDTVPHEGRIRYADVIPALFVGFLLNTLLLARVGEIARVSVLWRRLRREGEGLRVSTIAGTVLTEQVVLGLSLGVLLVGMGAVVSVPTWARRIAVASVVAVLVTAVALVALELYARTRERRGGLPHSYPAQAWWRSVFVLGGQLVQGLARGQQLFRHPARAGLAFAAGVLSWMAQIVAIDWTLHAFGIHHGIGAAALVFFTSTAVQLFPVLPANVGVFQVAVVVPLASAYGVASATALQFAIGLQLIEAALGVGLGFFFLWREGLSLAEVRQLRGEESPSEIAK